MRKSQFALEFVVLIAFMLLIFLGFFAATSSKVLDAKDEENKQIAQELSKTIFEEIKLAVSVEDGYLRAFEIPRRAKGSEFNVTVLDNKELIVHFFEVEHIAFLPDNVVGEVGVGKNEIKKIDGIIYLSNIAECRDTVDNDGDGIIDLADSGCDALTDNDESNCGDNICEGFESCLFCSQDCGTCFVPGKFILKASSNAMSIDNNGNAILSGILNQNKDPINPSPGQDEFIMKDTSGDVVALVTLNNGNMKIKGSLFENQPSLTPLESSDDFVIINSDGEVISYIDDSGNFYLKGTLIQNSDP